LNNYIVAAIGDWNKDIFEEKSETLDGNWHFVSTPEDLTSTLNSNIIPTYIFFLHWRWIVPKHITQNYECVCFHMTNVPYGRGGSPLQNLIVRGHKDTVLTALQMEEGVDSGPVYLKKSLKLNGTASEIYKRASLLSWEMAGEIILNSIVPQKQKGPVTEFRRRKPEDSEIPENLSMEKIYDYIRMLDAEDYPRAFIQKHGYKLEFENAHLNENKLVAKVSIKIKKDS
jgi:methionyl-tRNA formyltransferase